MRAMTTRDLLLAAAGLAFGVAAGEAAARALISAETAQNAQFVIENAGPYLRLSGETLTQVPVLFHDGLSPVVYPRRKRPGTFRAAVIGESSATILGRALESAASGTALGVLSLGTPGADARMAARRFDEAVALGADAVVLLFGNNAGSCHPTLPAWTQRAAGLSRRSMLARLALFSLRRRCVREDDVLVERLARAARARGLPLVACTVPSNAWIAPSGPPEALALYRQADRAWTRRRYDAAARALRAARDLDGGGGRATSAYNDAIRAAGRRGAVVVVDLAALADGLSAHGIAGWDVMQDDQHPGERLLAAETESVLRVLESLGAPAVSARPAGGGRRDGLPALGTRAWPLAKADRTGITERRLREVAGL
jgi:hypothetical protein